MTDTTCKVKDDRKNKKYKVITIKIRQCEQKHIERIYKDMKKIYDGEYGTTWASTVHINLEEHITKEVPEKVEPCVRMWEEGVEDIEGVVYVRLRESETGVDLCIVNHNGKNICSGYAARIDMEGLMLHSGFSDQTGISTEHFRIKVINV